MVDRPLASVIIFLCRAPVAQLDRASGYEPEGREFDSLRARHIFQSLAATSDLSNSQNVRELSVFSRYCVI